MLAKHSIIAFVPVRGLDAARAFYAELLGLPVQARDPFALVLNAHGIMIRCVVTDSAPQPFTILGWEVAEIHAAARDLIAAGIQPILYPHFAQAEDGVWTAPGGSMVLWFNDPFGNVLSLSQHIDSAAAPSR